MIGSKRRGRHFNEGRACDAVLRFLEHQRGGERQNLRFPEREGHQFPVDLVCELNGLLIALEHTGTEPFEGHVKLQVEGERRVQPLVEAVASKLPPFEDFDLEVPLIDWGRLTGREFDWMSRALVEWILETAPTLPIAELGRRVPAPWATVAGIPFPVRLNRTARYRGIKVPFHLILRAGDVEAQRLDRMRRTLRDKCPKLAWWKGVGARTALVLEWSDFQVTNPHLIAHALLTAESEIDNRSDVVYTVAPFDSNLCVYTLRLGDRNWDNMEPGDRAWEISMATLEDITAPPNS